MIDTINILSIIEQSDNYDIALFATYTIELHYFERTIISKLQEKGCKNISIFADRSQFMENLSQHPNLSGLGYKYIIHAIDCQTAFHPKMIMLLNENSAKLIIGSGNLTCPGHIGNYEYFTEINYSLKDEQNLSLIQTAFSCFSDMYSICESSVPELCKYDKLIFDTVRKYKYISEIAKSDEQWHPIILSNYSNPLITQIASVVEEPVVSIDICVPYYDSSLYAISRLSEVFKCNKINLYIQNRTSNFPRKRLDDEKFKCVENVYVFDQIDLKSDRQKSRRYHGKIFRIRTERSEYIIFGSPNCSSVALINAFKNKGNFEVAVLDKSEIGTYDYIFDSLNAEVLTSCELTTSEITSENLPEASAKFAFAYKENSRLINVVIINDAQPIKSATINGHFGEIVQTDYNMYEIKFDFEQIHLYELIYELDLDLGEKVARVFGWFVDPDALAYNRLTSANQYIYTAKNIEDFNEGQLLITLLDQFLKEIQITNNDIQSGKYVSPYTKEPEKINETSDSYNDDPTQYIVDDEPDNSQSDFMKMQRTDAISYFASILLAPFRMNAHDKLYIGKEKKIHTTHQYTEQQAQTIEKRMQQLFGQYLRMLGSDDYQIQVDSTEMLNCMIGFMHLIKQMYANKLLMNLIDLPYIAETEYYFANIIIDRINLFELVPELKVFVYSFLLEMAILNFELIDDAADVCERTAIIENIRLQICKLDRLDEEMRENYYKYYDLVNSQICMIDDKLGVERSVFGEIIEKMFRYRTWEQIRTQLSNKYHDKTNIYNNENKIQYEVWVSRINLQSDLDEYRQIQKTMKRYGTDEVTVIYYNLGNENPVKMESVFYKERSKIFRKRYFNNGPPAFDEIEYKGIENCD